MSQLTSELAISVADLTKDYDGLRAVDSANFEVPLGTICGFVGPNGSGKTTTIRMLLGLMYRTIFCMDFCRSLLNTLELQ